MAEIFLFGVIGDSFDKLDAAAVTASIRASTGPLAVHINSPGGYVMEGLAILQAIRVYGGHVTAYVDGLAASMASVIAMGADEIIMAESSLMMIHRPWDVAVGDAAELRKSASTLDKIEEQIVNIYAKQTGIDPNLISEMLAAETWLTAEEALAQGFATSISASLKIAAIADFSAFGFRRAPTFEEKEPTVTDPLNAVQEERTRISTIMALGTKHRIPENITQDLIVRGLPLDQARAVLLDHLAAQSDAAGIGHNVHGTHGNHTTLDNPGTYGAAIRDALTAKIGGKQAEGPAAEFQGMSVVDIARDWLSRNGARDVHRISPDRVINMAMQKRAPDAGYGLGNNLGGVHTTSDFPDLVGGAAEKYLIDRYHLQESPLKQLARQASRSNFLTQYGVQVDGGLGPLDTVDEAGEFTNRTLRTRKEGYALKTYGNMFAVSRQMLINDSLQALADILQIMAGDAAETEAIVMAAVINGYIMADGNPWFHASHGNLAPAGAPPTIATLDAGRLAMRSQLTASGGRIDANPKFLLVPVGLQTAAETLASAAISPTNTADVNPFAGKLAPLADPRLASATAWYLFADPNLAPAMEYAYLEGQATPFMDSQEGWRVDGTEYKVRHDFGAGVIDARLAWKNPGA